MNEPRISAAELAEACGHVWKRADSASPIKDRALLDLRDSRARCEELETQAETVSAIANQNAAHYARVSDQLAAMQRERDEAREAHGIALDDLRDSRARCEELEATVKRIWAALGISNYEQAGGKEISQLVAAMQCERDEARDALIRKGYRKSCDIPACNCGDRWHHGGHAELRLAEIYEALGQLTNGATALTAINTLAAQLAERDGQVAALRVMLAVKRARAQEERK